jgi:hypothetical protein
MSGLMRSGSKTHHGGSLSSMASSSIDIDDLRAVSTCWRATAKACSVLAIQDHAGKSRSP